MVRIVSASHLALPEVEADEITIDVGVIDTLPFAKQKLHKLSKHEKLLLHDAAEVAVEIDLEEAENEAIVSVIDFGIDIGR